MKAAKPATIGQLPRRVASPVEITEREHDLGVRGQQSRPLERRDRLAERAAQRGARSPRVALGQPQQRQTRLRLPAAGVGIPVGGLGGGELPLPAQHLGLLIRSLTGSKPVHRPLAALPCPPRLLEGLDPLAMQPQDLRPVCQTAAGEGDEVRLTLPPARQCRRPFVRSPQLVCLLAARDRAAIDDPRDHRRQLAADRSEHGLVRVSEPLLEPSKPDQRNGLNVRPEREQIAVSGSLSDRGRFACNLSDERVLASRFMRNARGSRR